MEEQEKDKAGKPEKESLLDKAKKIVDKADDFLDEKIEQAKKSETFDKVSDAIEKAEDFVGEKIEEFKKSETREKIESLADKAEDKADDAISKLKEFGKKVAGKTADTLDDIADNLRKKSSEEDNSGKA